MSVVSQIDRYPCSKCAGAGSTALFTSLKICKECNGRGWHAVPVASVAASDDAVADPGPYPFDGYQPMPCDGN